MFGQAMIRKFDTHRSLIHFECWEVTCLKYDVEHVRLTKEFGHLILINFVQCQPVFNSDSFICANKCIPLLKLETIGNDPKSDRRDVTKI